MHLCSFCFWFFLSPLPTSSSIPAHATYILLFSHPMPTFPYTFFHSESHHFVPLIFLLHLLQVFRQPLVFNHPIPTVVFQLDHLPPSFSTSSRLHYFLYFPSSSALPLAYHFQFSFPPSPFPTWSTPYSLFSLYPKSPVDTLMLFCFPQPFLIFLPNSTLFSFV